VVVSTHGRQGLPQQRGVARRVEVGVARLFSIFRFCQLMKQCPGIHTKMIHCNEPLRGSKRLRFLPF
jgi:hypothetical protein